MKKYVIGLIFLAVFAVGIAAVVVTNKTPIQNFIVAGTDVMLYFNNDPKYVEATKNMNEFMRNILKEEGNLSEDEMALNKKIEDAVKKMRQIMVIHTEQNIKDVKKAEDLNLFIVLEAEESLLKDFEDAVKKDGKSVEEVEKGYYKLALGEKVTKAVTGGQEIDAAVEDAIDNGALYFTKSSEYLVCSFSLEKLKSFVAKAGKKEQSKVYVDFFNANKAKNLGFGQADIGTILKQAGVQFPQNNYVEELNFIKLFTNYNIANKETTVTYELTGKGKLFSIIDSSKLKERKLATLVSDNTFYFSNNSFKALGEMILEEAKKNQMGAMYASMADSMLGEPLPKFLDNIGDEIVVAVDNSSEKYGITMITNLKSQDRMKKSLEYMGFKKSGTVYTDGRGETVTFKDKKMYITTGQDSKKTAGKKANYSKEITKDTVMFMLIDGAIAGKLAPELSGAKMLVRARASGNNLALDCKLDEESVKKFIVWAFKESKELAAKKEAEAKEREAFLKMMQEEENTTESAVETTEAAVE